MYRRDVDGVLLTQASGEKSNIGDLNAETYQVWPGECVEVRVNDNGVVGFDYTAPVEITETTVTGAALRPFSQIRDTFETMVCVVNASENCDHALAIDRVRLSYSRISEPDHFDSGLIVPVWGFEGTNDEIYHFSEE